jgi:predicted LPLAT superfamily acyltransferase
MQSLLKIYRNYYLFGQTLIDKVVIFSGIPHRFTFEFEGEEHLRRMVSAGQGGLLISAHIGNWEIAGHLLQRLKTRIHIVMFDGEDRRIKEYLSSAAGDSSANIITISNDLSHIYAIHEAFRNNELVCIHADRFLDQAKTLEAPLLGSIARFPAGPFILAEKNKVPVSFVFAMKENPCHYHFYATDMQRSADDGISGSIPGLLRKFTAEMEDKLRKYPEQWYNYYEFWSRP